MEAMIVAATAMKAIGAIQAGNASKKAADYNATLMDQGAATERQQAAAREEAKRREASMILGKQTAALAQSGGGLGGSAADVMRQSSINAELDALTLRYEGDLRARGLEANAAQERFSGDQAKYQGRMQAIGSILGGASDYMGYKENQRYRQESLSRMGGGSSSTSGTSSGTGLKRPSSGYFGG